jgi:hypothetical protein
VNWTKSTFGYISILLVLLGAAFSCTKITSTEIGQDLIPAVDNIHTFDTTLEVITENFAWADSTFPRLARTTTGGAPEMMVGYISNDPQFGKTDASMYFFLSPPQYPAPYQVKDSLYLDSVVLCLRWSGSTVGDSTAQQKFNVFKLTDKLNSDSAYRTDAVISYNEMLGSKTFSPTILNDSLVLSNQRVANQLRIRLSDDFGRQILSWDTSAGQPLHNDTLFRNALPGFAVVPDVAGASSANAIMGFLVSDTNSYLRIYYRYDTLAKQDTTFKTYKYVINGGFANNITRNYTGSEFAQTLGAGPDSISYIQTAPGTYTTVNVSSLNGFKALKGNVVINRAELVMTQIPAAGQFNEYFAGPELLYIDYYDTASKTQYPFFADGFVTGSYSPAQLGGIRKIVNGPGGVPVAEYRFTLSRYVQGIVTNNNSNNLIYLYSPYYIRYVNPLIFQTVNRLATGRVKVGGGSNKQQKMYVRIIYSKI